jgi:hypothetical protein
MHYFGSWRNALVASGINLANVSRRRPKHLDREMMILWLQQRQAAGNSLKWTAVCLKNRGLCTGDPAEVRQLERGLICCGRVRGGVKSEPVSFPKNTSA